ncbi:hypothetical protein EGM97_17060 [Pseudomonas sp. AF32]|nr:hypothetical protein [Pseudomonas sp. AF32]
MWEQSLLAIAVSTCVLNVTASSRASFAPTGLAPTVICAWLEPSGNWAHLYGLSQNKNKEPPCSISASSPKPMPSAGLRN